MDFEGDHLYLTGNRKKARTSPILSGNRWLLRIQQGSLDVPPQGILPLSKATWLTESNWVFPMQITRRLGAPPCNFLYHFVRPCHAPESVWERKADDQSLAASAFHSIQLKRKAKNMACPSYTQNDYYVLQTPINMTFLKTSLACS